ncbi:hypothetical protein AAVH_15768 [Aphelenchoides avenae]|nr:hypothetical protein AAVH_15768 [Aphelenchus avenae]
MTRCAAASSRQGLPRFAHWWRPRSSTERRRVGPSLSSAIFLFALIAAIFSSTPVSYAAPAAPETAVDLSLHELEVANASIPANETEATRDGGELITDLAFTLPKRSSRMQAVITPESWEHYQEFKKTTCRKEKEEVPSGLVFTSPESGFFTWEESVFHQELRRILLPDTSAENFTALLSNRTIIEELDSRLLASEMESLCTEKDLQEAKAVHDQAAFVATEKALFEDYLINKILPALMGGVASYNASASVAARNRIGREMESSE